jgi:hypothetical protein
MRCVSRHCGNVPWACPLWESVGAWAAGAGWVLLVIAKRRSRLANLEQRLREVSSSRVVRVACSTIGHGVCASMDAEQMSHETTPDECAKLIHYVG